jgi:hypothetical protein
MVITNVNAQSLEKLLKLIGLQEGTLTTNEMNTLLNNQRVEFQGSKPQQKIKKMVLPSLLD